MSRPGKGNKAPIFSCSPLHPAGPPLPAPWTFASFFSPSLSVFSSSLGAATASPEEEGETGSRGRPWGLRESGGWEARGPRRGGVGGRHRPGREPSGPPGSPRARPQRRPWEPRSRGAGHGRSPGDKKGCVPGSRVPLPRPPQPCLSAGSQVITNPWRGAEAEHLPERHGDDE